jgi:hypothetical protein
VQVTGWFGTGGAIGGGGAGSGGECFGVFGGGLDHAGLPVELAVVRVDGTIGAVDEAADSTAALAEGVGEGVLAVPVVHGAGEVVVAEGHCLIEVAAGQAIDFVRPHFVEDVLGVEFAEARVVGELGGGPGYDGGEALLPFGREDVLAGVDVVFAGVLRGAGLAFRRAGAGGLLRVGAVGGEALFGHTDEGHGANSRTECSRGKQGNWGCWFVTV